MFKHVRPVVLLLKFKDFIKKYASLMIPDNILVDHNTTVSEIGDY